MWGATFNTSFGEGNSVFQSTRPCGARLLWWYRCSAARVSIHAPVWGATAFASRVATKAAVSIHAPVWGATGLDRAAKSIKSFNPRARVGRDLEDEIERAGHKFQSTRPCGARPAASGEIRALTRFNPRARVGRDLIA